MTRQWITSSAPWYVDAGGRYGVVRAWLSFDWTSTAGTEYLLTVPLSAAGEPQCLVWLEFDQRLMERADRLDVLSERVQAILAEPGAFDGRWGMT